MSYTASEEIKAVDIPIEKILVDDSFNCRGAFSNFDVAQLASDIAERGLLQPVIVTPVNQEDYEFRLIAGFRRLAACKYNKRINVPAVIKNNITEIEARAVNLIENIQRKDLDIYQEAIGIKNLVDAGCRQQDMADYLGVSTGWLAPRLALLKLPVDIQKEARVGYIKATHIMDLVKLPTYEKMYEAVRELRDNFERGERKKVEIIKKVAPKPPAEDVKKVRNLTDIRNLQTDIREAIGNGLPTRVLAWCAGEIADHEVYKSLKDEADRKGIHYKIPDDKVEPDGTQRD